MEKFVCFVKSLGLVQINFIECSFGKAYFHQVILFGDGDIIGSYDFGDFPIVGCFYHKIAWHFKDCQSYHPG